MAQYLIGIDAGTSVTKSVLFSNCGEQLLVRQKRTKPRKLEGGRTEHDMWEVWLSVKETLAELLAASPVPAGEIAAIGLTAQGDGTWLLGRDGRPVCPAISWLDARTAEIIADWERSGIAAEVFSRTGTVLSTSLQSGQLRWLKQHRPELLAETTAVFHAKDWIFYQLTGLISIDPSETTHTYFDRNQGVFSPEVFRLLELGGWEDKLPPMGGVHESTAPLRPELAEELGLSRDVPVVKGPFDVICSTLGAGGFAEGDVVSIVGSSSIHNQVVDSWQPPADYCGHTVDMGFSGKLLRMFGSMSGTLNLDWAIAALHGGSQRPLAAADFKAVEAKVSEVPAGSGGVLYLPFIDAAGERAPFVKPTARAVFFGLHSGLDTVHMLRAVYEGVALSARDNYAHMPRPFPAVRVVGGGSRSRAWMQIWANATGKRLYLMEAEECGALGAAIAAGTAVGVFSSLESAQAQMVRVRECLEPDPGEMAVYDGLYQLYVQLCRSLWESWDQAASLDLQRRQLSNTTPKHTMEDVTRQE